MDEDEENELLKQLDISIPEVKETIPKPVDEKNQLVSDIDKRLNALKIESDEEVELVVE